MTVILYLNEFNKLRYDRNMHLYMLSCDMIRLRKIVFYIGIVIFIPNSTSNAIGLPDSFLHK